MSSNSPVLEALRQAEQLAFAASSLPLIVGSLAGFQLDLAALQAISPEHPAVELAIESGLTSHVYRVRIGDRAWTLKRARAQALVRNIDGQTSFLNEVQRRADLERLKRQPGGEIRWAGIVGTQFASYRDGVLLSPWIEGTHVDDWDERRLLQILELACELWLEGLFEWDLCRGNVLDDGRQLHLFDFGYMYRFNPLRQFSSAGNGCDVPLFHPAERFESRCFSAVLLAQEHRAGHAASLASFRREKEIALEVYHRMRTRIAQRGAIGDVVDWLDGITARWAAALRSDLSTLYLAENWRSHALDLDDDIRGQTCTPLTLRRADWLLDALDEHEPALRANGAFFWGDEQRSAVALRERYRGLREQATGYQLQGVSD
jgi:hypothetical protein